MTLVLPAPAATLKSPNKILEFCQQQPLGAVSFVIIFAMMFAGLFSGLVAPYDPLQIDFASILAPPSADHWCGTDAYGRDICSRLIFGSRTALVIGFTSSFLGSSLGAMLGVASAYFGGRIDNWIQRFMDILLAFPLRFRVELDDAPRIDHGELETRRQHWRKERVHRHRQGGHRESTDLCRHCEDGLPATGVPRGDVFQIAAVRARW